MSLHKKFNLLRGPALLEALQLTSDEVKILRFGVRGSSDNNSTGSIKVTAAMAILIARAGSYEGKARSGRVYYIREVDERNPSINDPSYWDGRSCTKFQEDQFTEIPKARTRRRAEVWNRLLNLDPPPLSWRRPQISPTV